MSFQKFVFIATFRVHFSLSKEFQQWMEDIHFKDLHKTGCFYPTTKKVLDEKSEEDYHHVVYMHQVHGGENGWQHYNKDFRPKLRQEFMDRYQKDLDSGKITVVMTAGYRDDTEY